MPSESTRKSESEKKETLSSEFGYSEPSNEQQGQCRNLLSFGPGFVGLGKTSKPLLTCPNGQSSVLVELSFLQTPEFGVSAVV